jgi:hypothetical protein
MGQAQREGRGEDASIEINEAEGKAAPAKQEEKPRSAVEVSHKDGDKVKSYAEHAGRIFAVAWEEAKRDGMIPAKTGKNSPRHNGWTLGCESRRDFRSRLTRSFAMSVSRMEWRVTSYEEEMKRLRKNSRLRRKGAEFGQTLAVIRDENQQLREQVAASG